MPPKVENAPGLAWRPCKAGWEARWRARGDLIRKGFSPKTARLWKGTEPSDAERAWIIDRCNFMQSEMLVWGRGGTPTIGPFDGTLKSLVACYQTDPDSRYKKLRFRTRQSYDALTGRIEKAHGSELVREIKARMLLRWHEDWQGDGKTAMAHAMVGMLRSLFSFGATILEDTDCLKAKALMHEMRFQQAAPRVERMTADQAIAVRKMAHEMGLHSLAFAQALQFELMLRQKDVIGEWVPVGEPGTSDVTRGAEKWLRGLRWSEIDQNMILRHTTSKKQKDIEVNLRLAPMVIDELKLFERKPTVGPMVIYEETGQPYDSHQFRRMWRKVARAAGVPDCVRNMDSRAGAITEATDAGADLEHVRHAATHGDIAMTQRYSRGRADKVANVMQLRAKHRDKSGTGNSQT